jgi:hypothetical protein
MEMRVRNQSSRKRERVGDGLYCSGGEMGEMKSSFSAGKVPPGRVASCSTLNLKGFSPTSSSIATM